MKFHNDSDANKPSVRDFRQFVSPSPRVVNKILLFRELTGTDLKKIEGGLADLGNDSAVCAMLIDTSACTKLRDDGYLVRAKKELAVPFFRMEDMTEIDNVFDSRVMMFDGHITSANNFDAKAFYNLFKLSQAQDLLLIPTISKQEDWQKILPAGAKILHVDQDIGDVLPPIVKEAGLWLLGKTPWKDKYNLKCVIEEINHVVETL